MNRSRRNYFGTIVAVYGATGNPPEGPEAQVTYDAVADEIAGDANRVAGMFRHDQVPVLRRVARNAIILAAQPGDPCIISIRNVNNRDTVFIVPLTEGIAFAEACP